MVLIYNLIKKRDTKEYLYEMGSLGRDKNFGC